MVSFVKLCSSKPKHRIISIVVDLGEDNSGESNEMTAEEPTKNCFRKSWDRITVFKHGQFGIIAMISAVILLYQSSLCVRKFLRQETGTGDTYVHISKAAFPIVTSCPKHPYNETILRANGISGRYDIQWNAK